MQQREREKIAELEARQKEKRMEESQSLSALIGRRRQRGLGSGSRQLGSSLPASFFGSTPSFQGNPEQGRGERKPSAVRLHPIQKK